MESGPVLLLAFWIVLTIAPMALWVRGQLLRLKRMRGRFTYRITDLWAAILTLSPALALLGNTIQDGAGGQHGLWLCASAFLVINQSLGMALGRLDIQLPPYDLDPSAWRSATSIFVGGVYGALLTFIPFFVIYLGSKMIIRFTRIDSTLRLQTSVGLVVVGVTPGSAAAAADLRKGDVLLSANGMALSDPAQLGDGGASDPRLRIKLQRDGAGVLERHLWKRQGGCLGLSVLGPKSV